MNELLNLVIDDSIKINKDLKQIIFTHLKNWNKEKFQNSRISLNDYKKLSKDYIYLEKLRSKLVIEVGKKFVTISKINYPNRYWEILISWIHFCVMILDRWEII